MRFALVAKMDEQVSVPSFAFHALQGEIATDGFSWYLSSGIVRYELVYGSLGTVVALMLWIYIGVLITLFGAHLSAAVARHRRGKR